MSEDRFTAGVDLAKEEPTMIIRKLTSPSILKRLRTWLVFNVLYRNEPQTIRRNCKIIINEKGLEITSLEGTETWFFPKATQGEQEDAS